MECLRACNVDEESEVWEQLKGEKERKRPTKHHNDYCVYSRPQDGSAYSPRGRERQSGEA